MERNITNIKERILYYTDYKGIAKEKFFEDLGVTYGSFKGKAKNQALSSDAVERIIAKHSDINLEWLLTGNGEMLKKSASEKSVNQLGGNIENKLRSKYNESINNIFPDFSKDILDSMENYSGILITPSEEIYFQEMVGTAINHLNNLYLMVRLLLKYSYKFSKKEKRDLKFYENIIGYMESIEQNNTPIPLQKIQYLSHINNFVLFIQVNNYADKLRDILGYSTPVEKFDEIFTEE